MNALLFIKPVLQLLDAGSLLRRLNAALLFLLAVAIVGGLGYTLYNLFGLTFSSGSEYDYGESSGVGVGKVFLLIFSVIIVIGAIVTLLQVLVFRGLDLWNKPDTEYSAIQSLSSFIRAVGESLATLLLTFGLIQTLAIWFKEPAFDFTGPLSSLSIIPFSIFYGMQNMFVIGLLMLLNTALTTIVVLTITHFIAEWLVARADIAWHLRVLRERPTASPAPPPVLAPPVFAAHPAPPPPPMSTPPPIG
jgi:hypothetical protein